MARIINGDRIAKTAQIRTGCAALIWNNDKTEILLTRRTDNGLWCLPGGGVDPGETVEEACIREVWEETGLQVRVERLIGVYSSPNRVIQYADGNRFQIIGLMFAVEVTGGQLTLNHEVSEFGYFAPAEIAELALMEHHRERIVDALADQSVTFIR
ncbi:MAG: NUDIX domain-containing protein [Chloroflexi bacterium]|uniref:NUDIX domain-containing protein n=1 Tax=Candidatus Flexifilum breve TaxID=3140694 RepID=UPI00313673ED|nr:NUDIX domain-containing protein [Chloroflexota bacterium]